MKILFATDGSTEALRAREFLGSLPLASGSELLVVSVVPHREALEPEPAEIEEQAWTPPVEQRMAQDTADQAAYYLAKPGVSTECLVTIGHPAEVICRIAEERKIELIVAGSRGRSALSRFIRGSVSQFLVMHAPCPVLIVKSPSPPVRKVLLGVDGSGFSRQAVSFLKHFPLPLESTVVAVHVVHVPAPTFGGSRGYYETAEISGDLDNLRRASEVEGKKIVDEAAKTLQRTNKVESMITAGQPAPRLLDLAEEVSADLLVVGSRGLTGMERFLTGSVSLQVCQHAPCSVLVVREPSSI